MGNTKLYTKIMATPPIQGLESQKPADPFTFSSRIPGSTPALLEQVPDVKIPPDSVGEALVEAEPDVALPHGLSHLALQGLFLGNLRGRGRGRLFPLEWPPEKIRLRLWEAKSRNGVGSGAPALAAPAQRGTKPRQDRSWARLSHPKALLR